MSNLIIDSVFNRATQARSDSDFTYFFSLLLAAEAVAKLAVLGLVSSINDDRDRNRYRLEHTLVRADGLGDWARVLDDALTGPASQFLDVGARDAQRDITVLSRSSDWQYECVSKMASAMAALDLSAEDVPTRTDMRRWFRMLAVLRNKTRAHGATLPSRAQEAVADLAASIELFARQFSFFHLPWAYLHRNLSGKYRVSSITENTSAFSYLTRQNSESLSDGVYLFLGRPRKVSLLLSDPDLRDFFMANGGFTDKEFELLSYATDSKSFGLSSHIMPLPVPYPRAKQEGTVSY